MSTATSVKYETRSVKTVRGMEARTRAKLEKEGWEFVAHSQGTLRSELIFRRPRPVVPWKMIGIGGGLLAILVIVLLTINALGRGGSSSDDAATIPTPTPFQVVTTEASTPSVEPAPADPVITATTVDELLDNLNSAQMGGITVGDQFRLTGELFMSKLWMTGAAGEYNVLIKAHGGGDDLSVFVDKSDAAGWQDGTKIQMVVEMGEATINGETTNGWLRALSVETIP
ncbi:hypothetical protein [Pseudarthrobacter sulfonivorans]|uniref:hypothetical protein n=1 Tax=Pseudarthrobacter sulfonivorans TaxID=121292 RepID=UPI00277D5813|nr:hypothetical protein [Pseudarthrobacter sulfonivorans]MDQ0000344.1 hypothetical protein [Pseudarthrobacter sulfonivorans]